MNNNDMQHPARQMSGPNKFLQLAKQTKCPLAIHFTDGEVIPSCVIVELDSNNLLVATVDLKNANVGEESVITRAIIKKITPAINTKPEQPNYNR